ncbi:MAG: polymer-forming cytoskeletal protein [Patescibacteria group bacterium]|nr:polymer-forming cytoskeletal protein [Patescibacteria group bacterium]
MPLFGSQQTENGLDNQSMPTVQPPMAKPSPAKGSPATIIANGVRLEGEFKSQGDVQIEGEVLGTIETSAMLSVGSEAKVTAGVKAANAVIAGEIIGNVSVTNKLELKSTAKVNGEISCATIVVEAGAKMQGNIKCGSDSTQKTSVEPVKSPAMNTSPQSSPKPEQNTNKAEAASVKGS